MINNLTFSIESIYSGQDRLTAYFLRLVTVMCKKLNMVYEMDNRRICQGS